MAKLVSKTYGDALFEIALEEDRLDDYLDQVKAVLELLKENEDLSKLMNHPKIVKEEKLKVIENIFTGRVSDELTGLMRMMVMKDRFHEAQAIFQYFIDRTKEYKNIGTAKVTSATVLTDAQREAVKKRLLETTKYVEFEMSYGVDSSLIGGMIIRIGDRVVDSSIKAKLYELTKELSQVQIGASK